MMTRADMENGWLLKRLSWYLNSTPRAITAEMMAEMAEAGVQEEEGFSLLLAAFLGLDLDKPQDRALYGRYFPQMIRPLKAETVAQDAYYQNIRVPETRQGSWQFCRQAYEPYEVFVCDDLLLLPDGRAIPQIGFFNKRFEYPAVLEQGREWMLITPNEIATMAPAVRAAQGRVLAYGLGLGYFAYLASEKKEVGSVTVVERDRSVIRLFETHLLPQFGQKQKIEVVCADAFDFAETKMGSGNFDVVFTDLWHDPSDGVALYLRMKALEGKSPQSRFLYWIEKTLQYYL